MKNADEFDDLYKELRDRLLLEAYALTGDQVVARTAVRDAFTVAWHHWDKLQRVEDKEAWLRPQVWKRAQHRHTARPWHKEKDVPPEVGATLESLGRLSLNQRKTLVLTHLTPLPMTEIAREVGLPQAQAEAALQSATAAFALSRETPSTSIRTHFDEMRPVVEGKRWPRSTILRRAGTARRRTHTAVGVLTTVAAVVLSGMVVAQGETVDATLSDQGFERRATQVEAAPEVPVLAEDVLLDAGQVRRIDRGLDWAETATHDNTDGDGIVLPCQTASFADPDGLGAFVRFFEGSNAPQGRAGKRKRPRPEPRTASVTEMVELSRTPEAAEAAYDTAVGWFTGCSRPRTQLLGFHRLPTVGDEASVTTLRSWDGPTRTAQVGVARSGQLVTITVSQVAGLRPRPAPAASLLAASVNAACGSPGAGTCAGPPTPRRAPVPVAGPVPGMLSEFDLPPVAGAPGPWVGTEAVRAKENVAATRCDSTQFRGKGLKHNLTRTFLFPERRARSPFGLTETVAMTRNGGAARRFVEQVRDRLDRCADEGFGTEVTRLVHQSGKNTALTVWHLELEISDQRSLEYLMAIGRHRNAVVQLGFTPVPDLTMQRDDFSWLARRALERLPRLQLQAR